MDSRNTLLIIDDLEINRAILANIFKKKYNIVEVASGVEALDYIRKNPDKIIAILLDLVMPEINGIDVLKTIKAEKLVKGVPIFIITANNSEDIMYEAYELGVKDVLEKPFVPYFLKKRIENVIELYRVKEKQARLIAEKIDNIEELNQSIAKFLTLAIEIRNDNLREQIKNIRNISFKLLEKLKEERY